MVGEPPRPGSTLDSRPCPTCGRLVRAVELVCPHDGTVLDDIPPTVQQTAPPPPGDSLIGTLVAGRYRVQKRISAGGMGEVYVAMHEAIEKRVALKVLRAHYSQREEFVARFQLEAKSASRIKHPNVVDVFDFGQLDDGRFYLALELLEGSDLGDILKRERVLSPVRGVRLMLQVARALGAAHDVGVVHRDLKPENVFVQRNNAGDEDVKLVDFGIAKIREIGEQGGPVLPDGRRLTAAGAVFGTPEYMAPEQAAAAEVDQRADIYACGIILYEMFAGRVPYQGTSMVQTITMHLTERPRSMRETNPQLGISPELERIIMRCLSREPDGRPATMAALERELLATPEGAAIEGRAPPPAPLPAHRELSLADTVQQALPMPLVAQARTRANITTDTATSTSTPPASTRRSLAPFAILGIIGLGALAFAALMLLRPAAHGAATAEPSREATNPSATGTALPVASPSPIASPSPVASAAPLPQGVTLHVSTDPAGAVLKKGEFQVCDATPCDVVVQPNEPVELIAERAHMRGVARVLAQREQSVSIKLLRASKVPLPDNKAAAPPPTAQGRAVTPVPMCEVMEGDLKILRPCK